MCIIFSCLSVSVVLFIVSRISLIAWMKPSDGRESLGSPSSNYQFTLSNCFFLMLGAVLQRGEDICDKFVFFFSKEEFFFRIGKISCTVEELWPVINSQVPYPIQKQWSISLASCTIEKQTMRRNFGEYFLPCKFLIMEILLFL